MEEASKSRPTRIGLDTNIFIYYFGKSSEFGQAAKRVFDNLTNSKTSAVTSVISLFELLSHRELTIGDAREIEEKFFEIPNLEIVDVSRSISTAAADIRRKYGFRLADAIQLATSVEVNVPTFITNDEGLKKFKELKVMLLTAERQGS